MTSRVVLLHGLWMPGASMHWMSRRLAEAGHAPETFNYHTIQGGPEQAIPRLAETLADSPSHIVAHSLGGLVALATLERHPGLPVGRIVCLGSPLRGSAAAAGVASHAWGAFALGHSAQLLREGCRPCAAGREVGVVAGRTPLGLGRRFGHLTGQNDGTVAVAETRLQGLAGHVTIDASHTGLLFSAEAARHTIHFLREGRFAAVRQGTPGT